MARRCSFRCAAISSMAVALVLGSNAHAQTAAADQETEGTNSAEPATAPEEAAPGDSSEIIVTARKRNESSMAVPVVVTSVSNETLERFATNDLKDLGKLVPGMNMGHGLLSVGAQMSMRGVGTVSLDPGIDQSVALNIDGLQLTQGLAFLSAMFDSESIEALKGPQALFFGKSSVGGVIAIRSADPTDEFELMGRAGYEIVARERTGELIVSGPVTDTLKLRLAGKYHKADGYFRNIAVAVPGTGAITPDGRAPASEGFMVRGTALWSPTFNFDARLKVNFTGDETIAAEASQMASCPDGLGAPAGIPFLDPNEDCTLDRNMRMVYMDPAFFPGIPHGGVPWLRTRQKYGTLELNYTPASDVSLTSHTAYYNLRSVSLANASVSTAAGPALAIDNQFHRRDFTQEVRLVTDFASPVNFTLGAFYQDGVFSNHVTQRVNGAYPTLPASGGILADGFIEVDTRTYSTFGQVRWALMPELEIAAGARWTDEERTARAINLLPTVPVDLIPATPQLSSANVSPEATVTYRPNDDLTLFAAYKIGYKSGSYNVATVPFDANNVIDNAFGDERVEGGEFGIKIRALDRQLRANLAAYHYTYEGLQVGASEGQGAGRPPRIRTVNAGKARVTGIDFDASFHPRSIDGLTIRGAVNWNKARFVELNNIPCYGGQTIAAGCDQVFNPVTGRYTAQDLSGTPMVRAPKWQINGGFDYEMSLADDYKLILSNNNQFSSRFVTFLGLRDDRYQNKFVKSDLSLTLQNERDRWEVALIGKNLTDQVTAGTCSASNRANGLLFGGSVTGSTGRGPAGIDEVGCYADRGREVWLRVTFRN